MTTPITISLPPTPDQVEAILDAGPGATVHHPRARGRRVAEIKQALGRAGVPHRLVQTLGYSTTGAPPKVDAPRMRTLLDAAAKAMPDHPMVTGEED